MAKTVKVKKHKRDGVVVEAHDRDITRGKESLSNKIKSKAIEKAKGQKLKKLFFGENNDTT